jgi:hypothetical protein
VSVHFYVPKMLFFFFALTVLGCKDRQFGEDDTQVKSIMNPHKLPAVGPWFEGWYMRITPTLGTDRSLGAIVGSYLPENSERIAAEEAGLSGYAALLDGGVIGGKLTSHETFPTDVRHYLNRSEIVDRDPMPSDRASYRWMSPTAGEFSAESIELKISKDIWLRARWSDIVPWSSNGLGPEGIISLFRAFPLHWFVYSLGSPVEFEAQLPDPVNPEKRNKIVGRGYAHLEKNWGVSFPESYVWMQAHDANAKKTIALAGGRPISIAGIKPEAWLVGFRSELFKQDFVPQNLGTVFTSRVDACLGKFSLTAAHLNRKIVVEANARRDSFGGISIPKKSGFESDGSEQSFQAQIVSRLYEVAPFGLGGAADRLIDQSLFKTGALEFGGTYKCQQ